MRVLHKYDAMSVGRKSKEGLGTYGADVVLSQFESSIAICS